MCSEIDVSPFQRHVSEAEKLLSKYELKLNEYNDTSKVQTDLPLSEVSLADEAWHSKMSDGKLELFITLYIYCNFRPLYMYEDKMIAYVLSQVLFYLCTKFDQNRLCG